MNLEQNCLLQSCYDLGGIVMFYVCTKTDKINTV